MIAYDSFDEIKVGDGIEYAKTMPESETYIACGMICALNPVHIDEEYCKKTTFKKRIGVALLVNALPINMAESFMIGPGTQVVTVDSKFVAPVYYGDTIKARIEVTEKDASKKTVSFKHELKNQDANTVMVGTFVLRCGEGC